MEIPPPPESLAPALSQAHQKGTSNMHTTSEVATDTLDGLAWRVSEISTPSNLDYLKPKWQLRGAEVRLDSLGTNSPDVRVRLLRLAPIAMILTARNQRRSKFPVSFQFERNLIVACTSCD